MAEYRDGPLINCCTVEGCSRDATRGFFCDIHVPGGRHPNSARFHDILRELGTLHDRKQRDYGKDDDPFANVRASSEWGMPEWVGAMLRLTDKVRRLQALRANGRLANESAEDSMRDIAVYAIIALVLFEEEAKMAATGESIPTSL